MRVLLRGWLVRAGLCPVVHWRSLLAHYRYQYPLLVSREAAEILLLLW